jgi:hypothetical protein
VPRTKTAQFVRYQSVLRYRQQAYPLPVDIPCNEEFADNSFRVKFSPVRVKPRTVTDILRDESGTLLGSQGY